MRISKRKKTGILIAAVIIIWMIIFGVDYSRAEKQLKPIFMIETVSKECGSRCKRYIGFGYWIDATRFADSNEINNVEFYLLGLQLLHLFG